MRFSDQLSRRRDQLKRTNASLAALTGYAASHLSAIFRGKKDSQGSTLEALANAVDAQWVLVPNHLMPEVERLLSGKPIGPDDVPSGVERVLQLSKPTTFMPTVLKSKLRHDPAFAALQHHVAEPVPYVHPEDKTGKNDDK